MNRKNVMVVVNYNDFETTKSFLETVGRYEALALIVVVDNNSTDGSYDALKVYESNRIKILKADQNGGYGYGNNVGCRYVESILDEPYNLIISNPDVLVTPETIESLGNYLDQHEKVGAVGPVILENGEKNRGWKIPSPWQDVCINLPVIYKKIQKKKLLYPSNWYEGITSKVEAVSGCFFMIKGEVFKALDYFDEQLFLYYEENVLGKQLAKHNWEIRILNKLEIIHNHSISIDRSIANLKKFNILKKSQRYFHKTYQHAGVFAIGMLYLTSRVTWLGIKLRGGGSK